MKIIIQCLLFHVHYMNSTKQFNPHQITVKVNRNNYYNSIIIMFHKSLFAIKNLLKVFNAASTIHDNTTDNVLIVNLSCFSGISNCTPLSNIKQKTAVRSHQSKIAPTLSNRIQQSSIEFSSSNRRQTLECQW